MKKLVLNKSFSNTRLEVLDETVNYFKKESGFNCIATTVFHVNTSNGILFTMTVFYEEFVK